MSHNASECETCRDGIFGSGNMVWSDWHGRHITRRQSWEERHGTSVEAARLVDEEEATAAQLPPTPFQRRMLDAIGELSARTPLAGA